MAKQFFIGLWIVAVGLAFIVGIGAGIATLVAIVWAAAGVSFISAAGIKIAFALCVTLLVLSIPAALITPDGWLDD